MPDRVELHYEFDNLFHVEKIASSYLVPEHLVCVDNWLVRGH